METPVQVAFLGIDVDDKIEQLALKEAQKLERFHHRITSCRVVISVPHQHHRGQGNLYDVRIELHVPGRTIMVNNEPGLPRFEEVQVALREAFDKAKRQLEDYTEKRFGR